MVPIDCRAYIPTKSLRNFVSEIPIDMPEESDFNEIIKHISNQFSQVDKDFLLKYVADYEKWVKYFKYVPRVIKKPFMNMFKNYEAKKSTTGFTNLGVVKLPKEIEDKIEMIEFIVGIEDSVPYFFSCISVGNTLTLTATAREEGMETAQNIVKKLLKEYS